MYQRTTSTTSDADGDVAGNDYHDADQVTNDVAMKLKTFLMQF